MIKLINRPKPAMYGKESRHDMKCDILHKKQK